MIPIVTSRLSSNRCLVAHRVAKFLMLVPLIGCVLAFASCTEQGSLTPDLAPIGDGLKVIGYAVVGAAVLGVLGKLIK